MKRFLLILLIAALSGMATLIVGLTGFAISEGVGGVVHPDTPGLLNNWSDYIFLGVFLMFIPTGVYTLIISITLAYCKWIRASRLRSWGFSLLLTASFIVGTFLWSVKPWRTGFEDLQYMMLPLSWNLILAVSGIAGTEVALLITRWSQRRRKTAQEEKTV
jgi:hypothetical protein